MSKPRQQVVIIGGMHRSGTQMLTQIIAAHKIPMWQIYSGHSEDKEFMDFHREILERELGHHWMTPKTVAFTEQDNDKAAILLKSRENLPIWGWKDPRTTLFLGEWDELISDELIAFFIWRKCADVVASCMRRAKQKFTLSKAWNKVDDSIRNRLYRVKTSLFHRIRFTQLWILYNEQIIKFLKSTERESVLFNMYDVATTPELVTNYLQRFLERDDLTANKNVVSFEKISKPAMESIIPFWFRPKVATLENLLENKSMIIADA